VFHSLRVAFEVKSAEVASEGMTGEDEVFQAYLFAPFLDGLDVVVYGLLSRLLRFPVASGRESDSEGIEGVDLEVLSQLFEHSDEGERGASVAVEEHEMREFLVSHCIHFVHVIFFVDGDISIFEMLIHIQIGIGQCLPVDLHELFGHDEVMFNSRDYFRHEMGFHAFLLHH
jgi:hypothetical protein